MQNVELTGQTAAYDLGKLNDLKRQARENPRESLKGVSQQFESVFMQLVMKGMRQTAPGNTLFDNEGSKLYTSLLDDQMAQRLSGQGKLGLAKMIEQQMARNLPRPPGSETPLDNAAGIPFNKPSPFIPLDNGQKAFALASARTLGEPGRAMPNALPQTAAAANSTAARAANPAASGQSLPSDVDPIFNLRPTERLAKTGPTSPLTRREVPAHVKTFVDNVRQHAEKTSLDTGVPADFMVAQAALESGWGRHQIRTADGQPSHNLFGIKAGKDWKGPVAETTTVEYVNGEPTRRVERFRAYGSYAEAFSDYGNLISGQQRYAKLVGEQDGVKFARGLQQAGYATDPRYADKLASIIRGPMLRATMYG